MINFAPSDTIAIYGIIHEEYSERGKKKATGRGRSDHKYVFIYAVANFNFSTQLGKTETNQNLSSKQDRNICVYI